MDMFVASCKKADQHRPTSRSAIHRIPLKPPSAQPRLRKGNDPSLSGSPSKSTTARSLRSHARTESLHSRLTLSLANRSPLKLAFRPRHRRPLRSPFARPSFSPPRSLPIRISLPNAVVSGGAAASLPPQPQPLHPSYSIIITSTGRAF